MESGSELGLSPTLLRRGCVLLHSIMYYCVQSLNKGGYRVYSMNKTGGRKKLFITSASAEVDGAGVQHLLKPLF